jgi:polyisoprenyl-teichoic acid--peptidoglycan teichoic acid transferase
MGRRMDKKTDDLISQKEVKIGNLKRFIISLLIILFLAAAAVFGYGYYTISRISHNDIAAKKTDYSKPVNILLLGVDAGDYNNHTKNNPNRSDTMMVLRFIPKTSKVYILSLPRDTKVLLKGHIEKLNAAHSMGGASYTISSVEKLLGIDINYYWEINYEGFRECVDAIGGVDITIPRDMDYDAWKISVHFKKGQIVHMNGEKAEEYVRWRKNNDGSGYATGDLGRIGTQQEFIVKVLQKMKTPTGLIRLPGLIGTISKYLKTNMTSGAMLEYALSARKVKSDLVQRETLPGEAKYIGGVSYYVWNKDTTDKFIGYFRGIEPIEEAEVVPTSGNKVSTDPMKDNSSTSNSTNEPAKDNSLVSKAKTEPAKDNSLTSKVNTETNRNKIDVVILNSTGKAGLAAQYKTKLEKLGYRITNTDNYIYKKYSYTIINDYSNSDYGDTILKDLGLGKIVRKNKAKPMASLVIILGSDSLLK